ncbi:uncharacterized protein V2V93DRAFT_370414 [Kockiozyma suomiensis]|uniref:uncharacterized protein n=1 Tax=Kockiozyma suomiensis TaxID=1337062 RepID=UPI003344161C
MALLHFLAILATFTSLAAASVPVTLHAVTGNPYLSHVGLYALHEGAGTSYFFLGSRGDYKGDILHYDRANGSFHTDFALSTPPYYLTVLDHVVQFTESRPDFGISVTPMGLFSIAGSTKNFFACKEDVIRDPFGYSRSHYVAMYFPAEVPVSCVPFSIRVKSVTVPVEEQQVLRRARRQF